MTYQTIHMRRRKIDTENLGENTPISLRLPKKILDWIQEVCDNNPDLYTGRNHFIETACRYYLNCEPCSNCGNLNYREAVSCSYCENRLPAFEQMLEEFHSILNNYEEGINEGFELFAEYQNRVNEILQYISSLSDDVLRNHLIEEFKRHLGLCEDFAGAALEFYDDYNKLAPDFLYSDLYKEKLSNIYTLESDLHTFKKENLPLNVSLSQLEVISHLAYYHACKKIISDDPSNHLTPEYLNLQEPLAHECTYNIQVHNGRLQLANEELNVFRRLLAIFQETKN